MTKNHILNSGRKKPKPNSNHTHNKLPKLPSNVKVQKRPLIHPPITSPYASALAQKTVYISPKTPFMSAVRRVRKLLSHAEARSRQSTMAKVGKGRARTAEARILAAVVADTERWDRRQDNLGGDKDCGKEEEVWIKGTGRATEKVLGLAEFFRRSGDVRVRLRTGSVWAVDDVIREYRGGLQEEEQVQEEVESEIPDSRLRQTSMLEVGVSSA